MSKLTGMNTQERMEDISRRSGLSIEICRRVLNAETASIKESLKHGERATLIGRVTLRPELRSKMLVGGEIVKRIKVKAEVSQTLESSLNEITEFKDRSAETVNEESTVKLNTVESLDDLKRLKKNEGVRLTQIPSLL